MVGIFHGYVKSPDGIFRCTTYTRSCPYVCRHTMTYTFFSYIEVNAGKTIRNLSPNHHFLRLYKPFPNGWSMALVHVLHLRPKDAEILWNSTRSADLGLKMMHCEHDDRFLVPSKCWNFVGLAMFDHKNGPSEVRHRSLDRHLPILYPCAGFC